MEQKVILFDLDGTLTDSGEGIINCVVFALSRSLMKAYPFSAAATLPSAFMKTSPTPAFGRRWEN